MESIWKNIAAELAELGPAKSVEQWKTTWRDLKSKTKSRNANINLARNRTGNSENVPAVTTAEEKILGITGKTSSQGLDVPETLIGPPLEQSPPHPLPAHQYLPHHSSPPHKELHIVVTRKEKKMLRESALIDYESAGHQRVLVSNSAEGLRNPDRMFQNQWAGENLPQGDLSAFWTPVTLKSQDFFMGTMNLVGERRPGVGDAFAFRSPLIARRQARHRWTTLIDNIIA
ncbi:unnamed protein product [Danaus chrysippus]|uniref:(African queen) hypothetical protein n=1 Tax=Danaus chrysippus TaxID=151541 RepID=A0A8J2QVT1_9NEOP|nr:unnamed protein product [Danaus chrysippus]